MTREAAVQRIVLAKVATGRELLASEHLEARPALWMISWEEWQEKEKKLKTLQILTILRQVQVSSSVVG